MASWDADNNIEDVKVLRLLDAVPIPNLGMRSIFRHNHWKSQVANLLNFNKMVTAQVGEEHMLRECARIGQTVGRVRPPASQWQGVG